MKNSKKVKISPLKFMRHIERETRVEIGELVAGSKSLERYRDHIQASIVQFFQPFEVAKAIKNADATAKGFVHIIPRNIDWMLRSRITHVRKNAELTLALFEKSCIEFKGYLLKVSDNEDAMEMVLIQSKNLSDLLDHLDYFLTYVYRRMEPEMVEQEQYQELRNTCAAASFILSIFNDQDFTDGYDAILGIGESEETTTGGGIEVDEVLAETMEHTLALTENGNGFHEANTGKNKKKKPNK